MVRVDKRSPTEMATRMVHSAIMVRIEIEAIEAEFKTYYMPAI
jgi:hypothetical protein